MRSDPLAAEGGSPARRRRWVPWLAIVAAVALGLMLAGWGTLRWANARCWQAGPPLVCRGPASAGTQGETPLVALSFDDGPTVEGVDAVLPVLADHDAKATFFLIGEQVQKEPGAAARLVAAGHELGNHSWSHTRMVLHSREFYDGEITRTQAVLRAAGEDAPVLFRPPYGKKLIGLPQAVEAAGLTTTMWSIEDDLSGTLTPEQYAHRIVDAAQPGSIILMHVMYADSAVARKALPLVLEGLQDKGLHVTTVSDLLATG